MGVDIGHPEADGLLGVEDLDRAVDHHGVTEVAVTSVEAVALAEVAPVIRGKNKIRFRKFVSAF